MTIESLKKTCPWPPEKPLVSPDEQGWFSGWNIKKFKPLLNDVKLIVEIGSWLGLSTRFWLENSNATVICIDTWEGSEEHLADEQWAKKLPTLFDVFCVNQWGWRDRIIPIKNPSNRGLPLVKRHHITPGLIYIDGSHKYEDVLEELHLCDQLFPSAKLIGDDWNYCNPIYGMKKTVKKAVEDFCQIKNYDIDANQWAWIIEKNQT